MLLQHAWLAPVAKPATIMEEDEDAAEAEADATTEPSAVEEGFVDREVGEWVLGALDQRRRGVVGKAAKPALHTAPLDTAAAAANEVASPMAEK